PPRSVRGLPRLLGSKGMTRSPPAWSASAWAHRIARGAASVSANTAVRPVRAAMREVPLRAAVTVNHLGWPRGPHTKRPPTHLPCVHTANTIATELAPHFVLASAAHSARVQEQSPLPCLLDRYHSAYPGQATTQVQPPPHQSREL